MKEGRNHLGRYVKGHIWTEEEKKVNRQKHLGKKTSVETKLKQSLALKGRPKSPEHVAKVIAARKGLKHSEESKEKNRVWHLNHWYNEMTDEKKALHIKNVLRNGKHPNKQEIRLQEFVNTLGLSYKYTGNGTCIINNCNPDFVHDTKKKVIELFGEYWHRDEDGSERIKKFEERGYSCLIIWSKELSKLDILSAKIIKFDGEEER